MPAAERAATAVIGRALIAVALAGDAYTNFGGLKMKDLVLEIVRDLEQALSPEDH